MKLFLASELKHPDTLKKLEEYCSGFKNKTIAYIPTAANGEEGWESWKNGGSWPVVQSLGAKINLIQLENYGNESVISEIKGKDIIWLNGGMAGYLMYWLRRCRLDKYLKEILVQGTILAGSSAGAMVLGQTLQIVSWPPDSEYGAENIEPLKFVDFDIYPHFQDEQLYFIKKNYQGKKLYLLKNGEEIIVEDGKIEVIGEERVILGS